MMLSKRNLLVVFCFIVLSCNQSLKISVGISDATISKRGVWVVSENESLHLIADNKISLRNEQFGNAKLTNIFFLNSLVGWVLTVEQEVWETSNGGDTWAVAGRIPTDIKGLGRDIFFVSENLGFVIIFRDVWRTSDGGATWQKEESLSGGEPLNITRWDDRLVVGFTNGKVSISSDLGITWIQIPFRFPGDVLATYFNGSNGWVSVRSGGVFYTRDDGSTWSSFTMVAGNRRLDINSFYFLNDKIGYALGKIYDSRLGKFRAILLKTINGGLAWGVEVEDDNNSEFIKLVSLGGNVLNLIGDKQVFSSHSDKWTVEKNLDFAESDLL